MPTIEKNSQVYIDENNELQEIELSGNATFKKTLPYNFFP